MRVLFLSVAGWLFFFSGKEENKLFSDAVKSFAEGYAGLQVPDMTYNFADYFTAIPNSARLQAQADFFREWEATISSFNRSDLDSASRVQYDHLRYEIRLNKERVALEQRWVAGGRIVPKASLFNLPNHKAWYTHYTRRLTSTDISPEQVYAFGVSEVARVKTEIARIQLQLGFRDSTAFYKHLQHDSFFLLKKDDVIRGFEKIDSAARAHLFQFSGIERAPAIYPIEWPDAGPATPPGAYISRANNAYGRDVFQFNFWNRRYNRRSMEWLYMHEALPGHHLQSSIRAATNATELQQHFLYPGNFEGWACYVENYGKDVGLYQNLYSELGKWEWDLVRSARLVLDAGIHYYGWTREAAMEYWKKAIPGQDDIGEREVQRVTTWPAQALSYKAGAIEIEKLKALWIQRYPRSNARDFHRWYLQAGVLPLTVMRKALEEV